MRGSVLCGRPFWILGTVVWSVLIALDGCGGLVSAQPVTAVLRPLPSAPRIGIAWQPIGSLDDGAAVHITIEYTADVGWVGIGGSSTSGMDGPITVCQLREGRCLALLGARFSIHSQNSSDDSITVLQRTTDCDATSDESTRLCSLTFQRRLLTTSGVPAFHWGTAGRVIFATGDVGPAGAIIGHRGSDIGAAFIDFSLSTADQTAAPSSVPSARVALTAALWTCVLIVVIQIASFAKIRVHHRVRAAVGVTAVLAYLALWVAYIAVTVRRRPGSVDAWATALGDGCAVALGVMLITGSRRFFGQELLTVSHERMVLYHTATGTAFIGCLVAHMVRIVQVYQVTILVQWDQLVCGFISVLALVMFTTAMLRHRLSFSLFRTLHFSWIAIVLLSAWHAPSMVIYCCLPGLVLLSCTGLSMLLSIWGTRVESIHQFPRSGIVVIDMSRWHFAWLGGGRHPSMGIGPGQWCYVSCASWAARRVLGPLWHPFSVVRADVRWPAGGGWPRQHLRFIIKPVRPVADAENEDSGESPVRVDAQGYQVLGVGKRSVPWTVALSRMASQHHTFTTHSADEIALQVLDDLDEGGAYDAEDIKSLHPLAAVSPNKEVRAPVLRPNPPIANNPLARLVACGPYGRVQVPLLQYETVVMASGGVGVTPNLLTLQYLARMMSDERQQGAYSVRRVVWIWTLRDFELFLHVCHEDLRSYTQMLRAAGVNVDLIVTVIASSADDSHGEYLRMMDADTEAMLPVTFAREAPAVDVQINRVFDTLTDAAAVTSCGPKRFMEGVRNAVNATRSSSVAIHLHEESFAL